MRDKTREISESNAKQSSSRSQFGVVPIAPTNRGQSNWLSARFVVHAVDVHGHPVVEFSRPLFLAFLSRNAKKRWTEWQLGLAQNDYWLIGIPMRGGLPRLYSGQDGDACQLRRNAISIRAPCQIGARAVVTEKPIIVVPKDGNRSEFVAYRCRLPRWKP
jgi:hypothetical protein